MRTCVCLLSLLTGYVNAGGVARIVARDGGSIEIAEDDRGRRSLIRTNAHGVKRGQVLDAGGLPREGHRLAAVTEPARPADANSVVDLLVAYTPAARQAAGGVDEIEQQIALAIAETNTGLENSGAKVRLRAALLIETAYRESGDLAWDLDRLARPGDGVMDELHRLRDNYGADLVSLWVSGGDVCAQAYSVANLAAAQPGAGFHAVRFDCALRSLSFAHAVGRNLGAGNARDDGTGPGALPTAYASKTPGVSRTIMAFDTGCRCPRLNRWSNIPGEADNVAAVDRIGAIVAGYRLAPVPADPENKLPESPHPYPDSLDQTWTYTVPGAQALAVAFDERTSFEPGHDFLTVTIGNFTATYTGDALSGQVIQSTGNTLRLRLVTNGNGAGYGFRLKYVAGLRSPPNLDEQYIILQSQGTPPSTGEIGATLPPLSALVINNGRKASTPLRLGWALHHFLAPNGIPVGTCNVPVMEPGRFFTCRTTITIPPLPATGSDWRMRLSVIDWGANAINENRFEFPITITGTVPAALTSPPPGSVLAGPEVTFRWTTGVNVARYRLQVGRTPGGSEYFDALLDRPEASVAGLPTDMSAVYAKLTSLAGSAVDAVYRAAWMPPAGAASRLTLSDFTASGAAAIGERIAQARVSVQNEGLDEAPPFRLYFFLNNGVEDEAAEGFCAYPEGLGVGQTAVCEPALTVPSSLSAGRWSLRAAAVDEVSRQVISEGVSVESGGIELTGFGAAEVKLPLPGSTLTAVDARLRWASVPDADEYRLTAGSSPGAADIFSVGGTRELTAVIPRLPDDGRKIHVRLSTRFGDVWQDRDATYRAPMRVAGQVALLAVEQVLPAPPREVTIHQPVENVRVVVRNRGSGNALPFRVQFTWQQSTNPEPSGSYCVFPQGLAAGATGECLGHINVPPTLTPGMAGLAVYVDDERINSPEPAGRAFPQILVKRAEAALTPPESGHPYAANYDRTWLFGNNENRAWVRLTFDWRSQIGTGDVVHVTDLQGRPVPGSPFAGKELSGRTLYVTGPLAAVRLVSDEADAGWGFRVDNAEVGPLLPETPHPFNSPAGTTLRWSYVHPENVTGLALTFDRQTQLGITDELLFVTDGEGRPVAGSPFAGRSLQGATINALGREVRFSILRASGGAAFGFRVNRIEPRFGEPKPTLRTEVSVSRFAYVPITGTLAPVTVNVTNTGIAGVGAFRISLFWARGTALNFRRDLPSPAFCSVPRGLARGERFRCSLPVPIPDDLGAGVWQLAAVADDDGRLELVQPELKTAFTRVDVRATPNGLPESAHPYAAGVVEQWSYTARGAGWMEVYFHWKSSLAPGDLFYVTDGQDRNVTGSPFTGRELSGRLMRLQGDTVKFRLVTNESGSAYGFKVIYIQPNQGQFHTFSIDDVSATLDPDAIAAEASQFINVRTLVSYVAGEAVYPFLRYYFSTRPDRPEGGQYSFSTCYVGRMVPGEIKACVARVMVPPCLAPGVYYVLAKGDEEDPFAPVALNDRRASLGIDVRNSIMTPSALLPESEHPYAPNMNQAWSYVPPGDHAGLVLTFDPQTAIEFFYDNIWVQAGNGQWNLFGGRELAGRSLRLPGKSACIYMRTDADGEFWGFRVTEAKPYFDDPARDPDLGYRAPDRTLKSTSPSPNK